MIVIKIFKNNNFIGYFSFDTFDYKLKNNYNKKISDYLIEDFHIKNLRPLKTTAHLFSNKDLYNGVINSHLKELNELFTTNKWYKNYSYELCFLYETLIKRDKYE